jgi:hypothetical protein
MARNSRRSKSRSSLMPASIRRRDFRQWCATSKECDRGDGDPSSIARRQSGYRSGPGLPIRAAWTIWRVSRVSWLPVSVSRCTSCAAERGWANASRNSSRIRSRDKHPCTRHHAPARCLVLRAGDCLRSISGLVVRAARRQIRPERPSCTRCASTPDAVRRPPGACASAFDPRSGSLQRRPASARLMSLSPLPASPVLLRASRSQRRCPRTERLGRPPRVGTMEVRAPHHRSRA